MISYPLPKFEQQRREVQQRYRILEGSAAFDTNHAARTLALTLGVPMVMVGVNERYRGWFECNHGVEDADKERLQNLCALAQTSDRPFVVNDTKAERYFQTEPAISSAPFVRFFAGVPLRGPDGRRFGTLCVLSPKPRELTAREMAVLQSFAELVSNEICVRSAGRYALQDLLEVEKERCSLFDMATTDPLSEALNRRAFFHFSERELKRAARHNHPVSVLIFDIDHFKKVNDVHGHAAGDEVIKTLSRSVQRSVRDEDLVGRLGGEEFGVVLPGATSEDAYRLANRLRQQVKKLCFTSDVGAFGITISVGIAKPAVDDTTIDASLDQADKALYRAKRNGRDRAEYAEGLGPDAEQAPLDAVEAA